MSTVLAAVQRPWSPSGTASAVGRIVEIDDEGRPWVVLSGGEERLLARSAVQIAGAPPDLRRLPPVVLVFEDEDREQPIIIGWVHESLVAKDVGADSLRLNRDTTDAIVDGRRVVLRADEEIHLTCGASSILLKRDGHVVIKGAHLVSRSSGANKIKGANVDIN